jgi:hypothetical protein
MHLRSAVLISSAVLDTDGLAKRDARSLGVKSMYGLLDVGFKDDLSRDRSGHGAKTIAIVLRFALGLVRANTSKKSIKTRRKSAG